MNLETLSHPDRQRTLAALGRSAAGGAAASIATLDALASHPEPWRRWLAVQGYRAARMPERLFGAIGDRSRVVRNAAWASLLRVGTDAIIAEALAGIADTRLGPRYARTVLRRGNYPLVEQLVLRLADVPAWLDVLPLCSTGVVEARLRLLDESGSPKAWDLLARRHPRLTAAYITAAISPPVESGLLARVQRLFSAPGPTLNPRVSWRIQSVLPTLAKADPDAGLDVVEALFSVEGQASAIRGVLQHLAAHRPARTFDLIRARQAKGLSAPLSGLFHLVRFASPEKLGLERLKWAVSNAPAALPDGSEGRRWLTRLSDGDRQELVAYWLDRGVGSWGTFLFGYAESGPARERGFIRWRTAAQDKHGCIPMDRLHDLARDLREREARRHLEEVVYLQSRPVERRVYAGLLPWAEAESRLATWIGHPEGEERASALRLLIGTIRHDRLAGPAAVALVRRRKNEQDPVRLAMLDALAGIASARIPDTSLDDVGAIVGEALDAADLSAATARAAQLVAAHVLRREPEAGMALLARVLTVRGSLDGAAIGATLSIAEARRFDPVLARVTTVWVERERAAAAISLAHGLGARLRHMHATLDAIDGLCGSPHLVVLAHLLGLLRRFDRGRFARRAVALLAADSSSACLPDIARFVATRRTDLLDPLLRAEPMVGRFATGRAHWVLDFDLRFGGWTPAQHTLHATSLQGLLDDPHRDVPTCRWAIERLAALHLAPPAALLGYANDPRPPIRDIALRALPSLDGGEGLDGLLDCMGDDRARVATYALRRCLADLPRAEIIARLRRVPMTRVTVAKEVLRMMGELGGADVRDHLVAVAQTQLHRDVRIALLRALWDHIEFPAAWALVEAAAKDPDPILVGRLLAIPMGRLSRAADARLAALFGEVLSRKEPETRLGFLATVGGAPLRDESRVLFGQLLKHVGTPDPAEAAAALRAVLARMAPTEASAVSTQLAGMLVQRPQAEALVSALASALHRWAPEHHRTVARGLIPALVADRVAGVLATRLIARVEGAEGFASGLETLAARGHLHHDVVTAAIAELRQLGSPHTLAMHLARSKEPHLRRVALAALVEAAGPENGWTPERRTLLTTFQSDRSVEVAGPAAWVFPPLDRA